MRRFLLVAIACAGCATPEFNTSTPTDQAIAVHTFSDGTTRVVEMTNTGARIMGARGGVILPTRAADSAPFARAGAGGRVSPVWGQVDDAVGGVPITPNGLTCAIDGRIIVDEGGWYAVTLGSHGTQRDGLCVLVSKTTDPGAGWWVGFFQATTLPDYPGITRTKGSLWIINWLDSQVWQFPIAQARGGTLIPRAIYTLPHGARPAVPRDARGGDAAWFVAKTAAPGTAIGYHLVRLTDTGQYTEWEYTVNSVPPDVTAAPNRLPNGLTVSQGGSTTPAIAYDTDSACGTLGAVVIDRSDIVATQWWVCDDNTPFFPFFAFAKRSRTPLYMTHPAVTFDTHGHEWITAMAHGPGQWPQMHLAALQNDGQQYFDFVNATGMGVAGIPLLQVQAATTPVQVSPGAGGTDVRMADYLTATTDSRTGAVLLGGVRGLPTQWRSFALRIDP